MKSVSDELAAQADPAYRTFQAKLIPTVAPERVLGVRTPALRRYARSFARDGRCPTFLAELPHPTYEEMNLHAELIGILAKTPEEAFEMVETFLPHVDNWATCDLIRVPAFRRDPAATLARIRSWVAPHQPEYLVRFGIVTLITEFLGERFGQEQLDIIVGIDRPEYYINMARAWYLSMALVKHKNTTLMLFERRPAALDAWTHNKALQKARESLVVSPEEKAYLQSLKV